MARSRVACWAVALAITFTALGGVARAASQPAAQPVALVARGHALSPQALTRGAAALDYQVNRQLRRYWSVPTVSLRVFRGTPPAAWPAIYLVGSRPPAYTAGWHDIGASGRVIATVYLRKWRHNWTVGASHELLEMLIDPQGESISGGYLEEVCDPVSFVWYSVDGMYVSDFVTPAWFTGGLGPWDIGGRLHSPQSFARGGEEDSDRTGRWIWIGPGAHMHRMPRPVRLGRLPG
jgi:hypothetical protein